MFSLPCQPHIPTVEARRSTYLFTGTITSALPIFFPYAFNILSTCDFCLRIYSNRGHLLDLGCVRFCMVRFGVDA